jgi:ribosome production factor 1
VLHETRPRSTPKVRSLRAGLPTVKEFGELSPKLKFDEFDDMATDRGHPEGKGRYQPPPEKVEGGKGEEGVEDGESESKPGKKTKPPAVDGYQ